MKIVREGLSDVLKPRGADQILGELQRRLSTIPAVLKNEGPGWKVYQLESGSDLRKLVSKGYYGSDDIFSNYYFVIDEQSSGANVGIGVEVDLKGNIKAYNSQGASIESSVLEKYS
jgi:hypothetical protein